MINKAYLAVFIAFFFNLYNVQANPDVFKRANELYSQEKYDSAVVLYESLNDQDDISAELFYNLGNSYYKAGNLAETIVNYEKASLLSPYDKDLQFNLELVRTQVVDKIDVIPEFFLTKWWKSFADLLKPPQWALLSSITLILSVIFLFIYRFYPGMVLKKTAFFFFVFIFILSLIGFSAGIHRKKEITQNSYAIISEPSVTLKSSPSNSGTRLFTLHEGTKVEIIDDELSGWYEIRIPDGNQGWLQKNKVLLIRISGSMSN
jgi:tetratricopeptide (TPR) repeat protein